MNDEIWSRLDGVIKTGYIRNVDPTTQQVRVAVDGNVTDWIDWMVWRAGLTSIWSLPDRGEKVVVASVGGDLSNAIVLGSLYSDNGGETPSTNPEEIKIKFPDGSTLVYDFGENRFDLVVTGNGLVNITCVNANVTAVEKATIDAPQTDITGDLLVKGQIVGTKGMAISGGAGATVNGNMNIFNGDVKADGVGVKSHSHREQGDGNMVGPAQG